MLFFLFAFRKTIYSLWGLLSLIFFQFAFELHCKVQISLSWFQGFQYLSRFLGETSFPWASHYFLVSGDWGSCFFLVYYDWGSYYFRGVNIHRFTEKKTKWEIYKFITNVIMRCNSSDVISKSFDVGKRWSGNMRTTNIIRSNMSKTNFLSIFPKHSCICRSCALLLQSF